MTMKNFFIALVLTRLFLGILLIAGTTQNQGCLPWKEPLTVGGGAACSRRIAATPSVAETLAERRRSRTDRAVGCTTARVLKTRWATGPMPLRA